MGSYILTMSCVSGDDVQAAIHKREDVFKWLSTLDHEGANWSVVYHTWDGHQLINTHDITKEIEREYADPQRQTHLL